MGLRLQPGGCMYTGGRRSGGCGQWGTRTRRWGRSGKYAAGSVHGAADGGRPDADISGLSDTGSANFRKTDLLVHCNCKIVGSSIEAADGGRDQSGKDGYREMSVYKRGGVWWYKFDWIWV